MKSNVEIYTLYLVNVIHESREYRAYEAVKKKLVDRPDLREKVDRFRRESYELQNSTDDPQKLYEEMNAFYASTKELRDDPLFEEYISCELAVCRMLQKIATKVVDSVDLELDGIAGNIPFGGAGRIE